MLVFLQIVAFSIQNDWSGRPVLTNGKRPKHLLPISSNEVMVKSSVIFSFG